MDAALQVEVRQVPSSVINRRVNDMAAQLKPPRAANPAKKKARDLKEEAVAALLPQAFPREQSILGGWTATTAWCWTAPAPPADDIITALVKVLDGFSVEPQHRAVPRRGHGHLADRAGSAPVCHWQECELKSVDESQAVVRYARHPADRRGESPPGPGKQPTRLALEWDDRVSFVLGDNLQLKKLAFDDKVLEQAKAQGQRADDFDGNVLMVTAELSPLIGDLIDALDGLAVPGGTPAPTQAAPSAAPAPAASAATDDDDPPF
jgi:recombination associated protein RdgC